MKTRPFFSGSVKKRVGFTSIDPGGSSLRSKTTAKKWWNFATKVIAVSFALVGFVMFNGCANKERIVTHTVYQDVYIPVPGCDIDEPEEPKRQATTAAAVAELKSGYERYKAAFRACKGTRPQDAGKTNGRRAAESGD